ncbi:MAG: YebC/PmpR family DNA-binding transcriptional regulator [Candidatus Dasytiphilus stammeri]
MSGHSKWSNTKHRKAGQDAKREKNFNKIIRDIITATKLGGSNINCNFRLRQAIDKAIVNNMTRDTINRAINRTIGKSHTNKELINIIYEGYALGGIAIIVQCLTNNRKRTICELRTLFTKNGGNLVNPGSLSYLFKKMGLITYVSGSNEENLINLALEVGANDIIRRDNGKIDIYIEPKLLNIINKNLKNYNFFPESISITMIPRMKVKVCSLVVNQFLNFLHVLHQSAEVQNIFHNGNINHP